LFIGICLTIFASIDGKNKQNNNGGVATHDTSNKSNNSNVHIDKNSGNSSQNSPISNNDKNWWQSSPVSLYKEESCEGVRTIKKETISWTGITLCIVSRWPLVQQLQQCLLYLYHSSLLPSLLKWEEQCRALTNEHSLSLPLRTTIHTTRDGSIENNDTVYNNGDIDSLYLVMQPLLLTAQCIEILTKLCLEYPVPLWGIFSLDITLPAIQTIVYNDSENVNSKGNAHQSSLIGYKTPSVDIKKEDVILSFKQHPVEDLPLCSYSLSRSLFQSLGSSGVLTVLGAALAESKILFLSSDVSLLPAACESLRTMMYPLKWAHVYLPVVPAPLLDLVQAPVPFILGTLTKWLSLIPTECLCDVVIVNLDSGAIDSIRTAATSRSELTLPFPFKIQTWLLCSIQQVLHPPPSALPLIDKSVVTTSIASPQNNITPNSTELLEKDTAIQLLVFDAMANLLRMVPQCMFSLSTSLNSSLGLSHHVFNRYQCHDMPVDILDKMRDFLHHVLYNIS
jgi:hypothetical protein